MDEHTREIRAVYLQMQNIYRQANQMLNQIIADKIQTETKLSDAQIIAYNRYCDEILAILHKISKLEAAYTGLPAHFLE